VHRVELRGTVLLATALLALLAIQGTSLAEPLWTRAGKPTAQAAAMLEILNRAEERGLRMREYELELLPSQLQTVLDGVAGPELLARFDATLTASAATLMQDLSIGRVTARAAGFDLPSPSPMPDFRQAVQQLAIAADVPAALAAFEPRALPYQLLKRALVRYHTLAASSADLTSLPPLPKRSVAVGDEYLGAPALRELLQVQGDLSHAAAELHAGELHIDVDLAAAVQRFQQRHGLTADGVIGAATCKALTTPFAFRVQQIELALERWRWLGALPRPNLVINIPLFTLYALPRAGHAEREVLEMPVIVGRQKDRTPIFTAAIEEVVFHPYWDVPTSILHAELLPRIVRNPGYLTRHHFEIVRGATDTAQVLEPSAANINALAAGRLRLRQRPGADNALGAVKFVLPNRYGVRLHGTPEQQLFLRSTRAFSHGCIRARDPAARARRMGRCCGCRSHRRQSDTAYQAA
jgi:L,D-transpeptidase YcbB